MTHASNMTFQELAELTTRIDNYNYHQRNDITADSLHTEFWEALHRLRLSPNRKAILEDWKYKGDLLCTEKTHANEAKQFTLLTWEKSFVLDFWMGIYH